jgi:uncharacterized protein (TIGR02680 family)
MKARWQPLRCGILNMYRYDDEEFWFEDGHLLFRGNNGTGKSRVLALTLPFLLEGDTDSDRMEPDGDRAKKVEWNLLMGKHQDRDGYSWLELGRLDETGAERFLTLGCGFSATAGRPVKHWLFTTTRRVGEDLSLATPQKVVLRRDKLIEALGDQGHVHTTAKEYRAFVDAQLFGLGTDRYEALVELLVQLRKPQLSRQLNEKSLSDALGQALTPMPAKVLEDVAQAFQGLDEDRQKLAEFQGARDACDTFLESYRLYAQLAVAKKADGVRSAHQKYDEAREKLRQHERTLQEALVLRDEANRAAETLTTEHAALRSEHDTLAASPQMAAATELDRAVRNAAEAEKRVVRARDDAERACGRRLQDERSTKEAGASFETAHEAVARELDALRHGAVAIGCVAHHEDALSRVSLTDGIASADAMDRARKALKSLAAERRRAGERLAKLCDELREAQSARNIATNRLELAESDHQDKQRVLRDAEGLRDTAIDQLVDAYEAWVSRVKFLDAPPIDVMEDAVAGWEGHTADGPVTVAVRDALQVAVRKIATRRAETQSVLRVKHDESATLRARLELLRKGVVERPPVPHTRSAGIRDDRDGAPLWALCDFKEYVTATERAGLEAALESSGLLDAWVMPDGTLLGPALCDTFVVGGASLSGTTLADALRPAVDAQDPHASKVRDDVVRTVLSSIGLGDSNHPAWVDVDGTWTLGALHGRWEKTTAQYVGAGAREQARRETMARLEHEINELDETIRSLDEQLAEVDAEERSAREEASSAPKEHDVTRAVQRVELATEAVKSTHQRLAEARNAAALEEEKLSRAKSARVEHVEGCGLQAWVDAPGDFLRAVSSYENQAGVAWESAAHRVRADQLLEEARGRLEQSRGAEERAREQAALVAEEGAVACQVRDTLQAAVGSSVDEIRAKLADARRRRDEAAKALEAAVQQRGVASGRVPMAEEAVAEYVGRVAERDGEQRSAVADLRCLATNQLVTLVDVGFVDGPGEWSVTHGVEVARRCATLLEGKRWDAQAWERRQTDISQQIEKLRQGLTRQGWDAQSAPVGDGVMVVTVPMRGVPLPVAQVREELDGEVQRRQRTLAAREREILERHLVSDVAHHLRHLLRQAEAWVVDVNKELESRPMSTGMRLKFVWEPAEDAPLSFKEVNRKLMTMKETWSTAEREEVGTFLKSRIDEERVRNPAGSWKEHLSTALDYRRWHRFSIERQQDGKWQRLTKKTHGTGSGGEKALALTLPQFAAAAAFYKSALPTAPRMILLDEVFVGIDTDARSKCMDLLRTFDLDFVMTSEREWGCYATLPHVAICNLTARPNIDAVFVTRWVWDGVSKTQAKATVEAT